MILQYVTRSKLRSLAGYTIPKGTSIAVAVHNIHRDPAHWEKPDQFFPEHFTPSAVRKRHAYAYLPFSAGVRSCLGTFFTVLCNSCSFSG